MVIRPATQGEGTIKLMGIHPVNSIRAPFQRLIFKGLRSNYLSEKGASLYLLYIAAIPATATLRECHVLSELNTRVPGTM